jgi:hypothetical protein
MLLGLVTAFTWHCLDPTTDAVQTVRFNVLRVTKAGGSRKQFGKF